MLKCYSKIPDINDLSSSGIYCDRKDICKNLDELFSSVHLETPPRGNLFSGIMLVGYRPGTMNYYKGEEVFQYGPTSRFLLSCLKEVNLFPYFTNFYKNRNSKFDESLKFINKEIEILDDCIHTIVFLGKYKEYKEVNTLDKKIKIINHPSWALRFNKREEYINQLKSIKD